MGRLTCTCLNVSVHYKGSAWRGRPVSGSVLLRPPPSSGGVLGAEDRLARDELFEVELDVAGATAVSRGEGVCVLRCCCNTAYVCVYIGGYGFTGCVCRLCDALHMM